MPQTDKTITTISKILISSLLLVSIVLILFSIYFNKDFLLRWSYDGNISGETLKEVFYIRILAAFLSIIALFLFVVIILKKGNFDRWVRGKKNILQNLMLLIITLVIATVLLEISLWLYLKDRTEGAGFGPGTLKFNEKYVRLNNEGMRDYNFTLEKNNSIRIVVIGDSFTFGAGVKNMSNIYSKVLETNLEKIGDYEVYTFAIPGYNSKEEYELLKDKAYKYKPDIIIIGYFLNDLQNVDPSTKNLANGVNWRLPLIGYLLRDVSYTYYFIETNFNRMMENFGIKERWVDAIEDTYKSEINRRYTKEIYKNISSEVKIMNSSVIIVVFPIVTDHYQNYSDYLKFIIAHDFAKEIASENNFGYLDLLPYYAQYSADDLIVNPYDSHPNELGHKIAAEAIYNYLLNQSLISPKVKIVNISCQELAFLNRVRYQKAPILEMFI